MTTNSFGAKGQLTVSGATYGIYRLAGLPAVGPAAGKLPLSLRVLLENLLRHEDGRVVKREHVEAMLELGSEGGAQIRRSPSTRRACSCRTSPACPPSSISRRCATPSSRSAATRTRSTRSSRPISSSTTRCRSTSSAPSHALGHQRAARVRAQPRALRVPALGRSRRSRTSASCRPAPASATR